MFEVVEVNLEFVDVFDDRQVHVVFPHYREPLPTVHGESQPQVVLPPVHLLAIIKFGNGAISYSS